MRSPHINTEQETALLIRMAAGDMDAFDQLYWHYQRAVYQNAIKLTRNELVAEDIVQEVFIALWEKRETLDTQRSVGGWLFVTSYNRTVNALKKQLREAMAIRELGKEEAEPDPDISNIQLAIIEEAVSALSPQKRRVFELCKLQGLSYEEAAAALNISRHTVKEYLGAAMAFIRDYAQQHPGAGMLVLALFEVL